jgi:hypothetical protein
LLDEAVLLPPPTVAERIAQARTHLLANVDKRGPRGVFCTRRHMAGYLRGLRGASALRRELFGCPTLEGNLEILARYEGETLAA